VRVTKEEKTNKKQLYEVAYHLVSSIDEAAVAGEADKIREVAQRHGGQISEEGMPAKFSLAYTISRNVSGKNEKHDTSYFGWFRFEVEQEAMPKIQNEIDGLENVLRFLIVKAHPVEIQPRRKPKSVFSRTADKTEKKSPVTSEISKEELDKEIRALLKKANVV